MPANAWVLYDGECAFCTRLVGFWSRVLRRHGFAIGELQSPWVKERLHMQPEELMHDIRLLTREGTVVSGADVYLYVWRRIWWAWLLYAIFSLPGFNRLLHAGYGWIARNRYCISGACRIPH
jgi:predicted DCC family thiol-disulfide oxidoreductase YuxK